MRNYTTQQVNKAKDEVTRLKRLKKRFANEPEAQEDLNLLIAKQIKFVSRAQEIIEDRKIKPLT